MSTPFWDSPRGVYREFHTAGHEPNPWDVVYLARTRVPGVCDVRAATTRRIDTLPSEKSEAARMNDLGRAPEQIYIDCVMWMPKHLDEWEALIRALEAGSGRRKDPRAVDVQHPGLNALGVRSLYVVSIGVPEREYGGIRRCRIRCQEWRPQAATRRATAGKEVKYDQAKVDAILGQVTASQTRKMSVDNSQPSFTLWKDQSPAPKSPSQSGLSLPWRKP